MDLIAVMDANTANGMSPEYVADKIIEAVASETKEIVLGPLTHKLAILLRTLVPSLYFLIMSRRVANA
jgi:short-subunit dehydrogenase